MIVYLNQFDWLILLGNDTHSWLEVSYAGTQKLYDLSDVELLPNQVASTYVYKMDQNYLWNLTDYEVSVFGDWWDILAFIIIAAVFCISLLTNGATTVVPAYLLIYFT